MKKRDGGIDPIVVVATFFGTGFFPVAPATFASAVVTALMLAAGGVPLTIRLGLLAVVSVVGAWTAGRMEARYGQDARCIVIDEVAGMLASTLLIPWDLKHLVAAFLFFRVLDILKPPPAYQFESLPGGIGVMADDLVAGFYALLLLFVGGLLLPSF